MASRKCKCNMPKPERRFAPFELRSSDGAPGILFGVAMRYGDRAEISSGLFERFEAGAFGADVAKSSVIVNRQHDRAAPLGRAGGLLRLSDSPTELRAELTLPTTRDGEDVAELVRQGVLRGFSIEFRAKVDRIETGNTRVIESAELRGLSVVDDPAYGDSILALRARIEGSRRRWWLP